MNYLLLADGFEEIEALCPLDLLRRAGVEIKTVALGESREVFGAHGVTVLADMTIKSVLDPEPGMIILPGGMPGAKNLRESDTVCRMVESAAERGAFIGAICAAPYILGELGLLRGKRAVCFPGFEDKLEGAMLVKEKVVRDGNIITAAGMGVALEFGLALVEAVRDATTAAELRRSVQAI